MWLLLLPLPWFLMGLLAAGTRRRGGPGCFFIGGIFIWPQAQLLERIGLSTIEAWLIALALMIIFPILGYLLGMRLLPRDEEGHLPPGSEQ